MSASSANLANALKNMEGAELNALFAAVLERRCATCRFRRRKLCWKALEACLTLASDIPAEAAGAVRRFYVTPAHVEHMDDRFTSFDSYFCSLSGEQFHEYTRLTPQEFIELHERVAHRIEHPGTHRVPISTKHRLAIALRFLGHGSSFVALAHELKLGRSTVQSAVYECCRAIVEEYWSEAFPVPTASTWQRSADEFRSLWKYPRGVGSIDGKISDVSGSSCYNYKGYYSFVLLAVVNGAYRILAFDLGGKGRISDAGLFRTSTLKSFLERAVRDFPEGRDLGGEGVVDYHILADGGFAQQSWMQRPFRQAEVTNDPYKAHFNEVFSSARRIVESVFGIICARFRVFQRALVGTEDHCKLIVAAALVLHNLLADRITPQQLRNRYNPVTYESSRDPFSRAQERGEAQRQRLRLVKYFARRDGLIS